MNGSPGKELDHVATGATRLKWRETAIRDATDAHVLVSISDLKGNLVEVDDAFCRISGYRREELIGENYRMLNSAYHPESFWKEMWGIVSGGGVWRGLFRNRRKGGDSYWVNATISPLVDDCGEIREYISVQNVLPDLRGVDIGMGRLSDTMTKMSRVARIGTWELDMETGKWDWSSVAKGILEVGPEFEPSSKTFLKFFKEGNDRDLVESALKQAIMDGSSMDFELPIRVGEGRELWVRMLGQSEWVDEECCKLYGILQDVDQHKRTQRESTEKSRLLAIANDRLSLAVRAGKIGVWDWDLREDILEWNEQMHELYSVSKEELQNNSLIWFERLHPDDRERGEIEMKTALESEQELDTAFRFVWPDGSVHHIRALASVQRDSNGTPIRMIGTNWDISETMQRNEALVDLKEEAQMASVAKGEFLANMSHEIRTPMNGMIGMTALLLESETLTEEDREFAETAYSCGETLLAIVKDILDYSKIESGKLELDTTDFDLREIMDDFVSMQLLQAKENGLALACSIASEVPDRLHGDLSRLRQILLNLVSNAIKFTSEGRVEVDASLISSSRMEAVIKFRIRDTGIGIGKDEQSLLFERFTQTDSSATRKFGGTGLGLAISKCLVELMGGEIGIESEKGQGTEFWFTARLSRQEPESPKESRIEKLRGIRVLLLAASENERSQIRDCLSSVGAQVEIVSDRPSALKSIYKAQASKDPYCLAIIDLEVPGMSGLAVAEAIAGDEALSGMRVVALSCMGAERPGHRKGAEHFNLYLAKPIRETDFLKKIVVVLEGEKPKLPETNQGPTPLFSGDSWRVLIVEDDLVNQIVIKKMLVKVGLRYDIASNGLEAIDLLERASYDLVLMDVKMPELDGIETTSRIRSSNTLVRNQGIPIVGLTARASVEDKELCLETGMDDYLPKPVSFKMLVNVLVKWLPRNSKNTP